MIDLTTEYLGLKLKNPLVPSSSPLTGSLDTAKQLEDAGASALILPSIFEEVIEQEQKELEHYIHTQSLGMQEADSFHPVPEEYNCEMDCYLNNIQQMKTELDIPVIASLNCISNKGWIDYAKDIQQAGADALELNVYYIAADAHVSGADVENRYIDILQALQQQVSIPITMKLSSQFSSVANMVIKLENAGAQGVSLFNRFYQPDIDLESLQIIPKLNLSTSDEALLRIRWIALLRHQVKLSIAATGGLHTSEDIIKALLAGADITHLCSVLLNKGPEYIKTLLAQLQDWLTEYEYESVKQMQGSVNQACAINPAEYEHANYMAVLYSYKR